MMMYFVSRAPTAWQKFHLFSKLLDISFLSSSEDRQVKEPSLIRTLHIALPVPVVIIHTVDWLILQLATIFVSASPVTQYFKVTKSFTGNY